MHIPEGVIVAMLTPFDEDGKINEVEVRKIVNFLVDKKVNGIFPVSSSGEYVHLDMEERKYLIDIVVDEAKSKVDIIPGTGATCYKKSIELANYAEEKGCSAVVLHGPYFFNNVTDVVEGHIKKVAESVNIPIFVYNIPFFANEITPAMVTRLMYLPNIIGIKESSGNMINIMNLIEMTKKIDPNFKVLVGVEEIILPALLMGARGSMTTTSGILPEFFVGIWDAFQSRNYNLAYNLQFAILPLIREMKSINFPQGFKEALSLRGIKMGAPRMHYIGKSLSKLLEVKEQLRIHIKGLLENYYGIAQPCYYCNEKQQRFSYPQLNNNNNLNKKHDECNLCGKCSSDNADVSQKNGYNKIIDEKYLEEVIKSAITKVLNENESVADSV